MYHQGDLKFSLKEGNNSPYWDARDYDDSNREYSVKFPCAYLPHSCDSWIIGGPQQIRAMIADLQKVLRKMEPDETLGG